MDTIKTEGAAFFSFTALNTAFEAKVLSIKGASHDISLNRFSEAMNIMGLVIMAVCTLGAIFIVMGGTSR